MTWLHGRDEGGSEPAQRGRGLRWRACLGLKLVVSKHRASLEFPRRRVTQCDLHKVGRRLEESASGSRGTMIATVQAT